MENSKDPKDATLPPLPLAVSGTPGKSGIAVRRRRSLAESGGSAGTAPGRRRRVGRPGATSVANNFLSFLGIRGGSRAHGSSMHGVGPNTASPEGGASVASAPAHGGMANDGSLDGSDRRTLRRGASREEAAWGEDAWGKDEEGSGRALERVLPEPASNWLPREGVEERGVVDQDVGNGSIVGSSEMGYEGKEGERDGGDRIRGDMEERVGENDRKMFHSDEGSRPERVLFGSDDVMFRKLERTASSRASSVRDLGGEEEEVEEEDGMNEVEEEGEEVGRGRGYSSSNLKGPAAFVFPDEGLSRRSRAPPTARHRTGVARRLGGPPPSASPYETRRETASSLAPAAGSLLSPAMGDSQGGGGGGGGGGGVHSSSSAASNSALVRPGDVVLVHRLERQERAIAELRETVALLRNEHAARTQELEDSIQEAQQRAQGWADHVRQSARAAAEKELAPKIDAWQRSLDSVAAHAVRSHAQKWVTRTEGRIAAAEVAVRELRSRTVIGGSVEIMLTLFGFLLGGLLAVLSTIGLPAVRPIFAFLRSTMTAVASMLSPSTPTEEPPPHTTHHTHHTHQQARPSRRDPYYQQRPSPPQPPPPPPLPSDAPPPPDPRYMPEQRYSRGPTDYSRGPTDYYPPSSGDSQRSAPFQPPPAFPPGGGPPFMMIDPRYMPPYMMDPRLYQQMQQQQSDPQNAPYQQPFSTIVPNQ